MKLPWISRREHEAKLANVRDWFSVQIKGLQADLHDARNELYAARRTINELSAPASPAPKSRRKTGKDPK